MGLLRINRRKLGLGRFFDEPALLGRVYGLLQRFVLPLQLFNSLFFRHCSPLTRSAGRDQTLELDVIRLSAPGLPTILFFVPNPFRPPRSVAVHKLRGFKARAFLAPHVPSTDAWHRRMVTM